VKDNFSHIAAHYAQFRPQYPGDFISILCNSVNTKEIAWDCGTGNGQVAKHLAKHFAKVIATDISEKQIKEAPKLQNIAYKTEAAENASVLDKSVNLITVGQAAHWFQLDSFYTEARRVLAPAGVIAIFGYPLFTTANTRINKLCQFLFKNILSGYWDKERKWLDEKYQTIPFPFKEINIPASTMKYNWNYSQLIGYLQSWSAVQHYSKKNKNNPVDEIMLGIKKGFDNNMKIEVTFEIVGRYGIT
jgi:ubiquinone/menaquinone biosynthesis C-methylase UbiE